MNLDGATIARATGGTLVRPAGAGPVLTDTRALVPGAWFCALRGERFDAWDFLAQAAEAGAGGCIVSRPPPEDWTGGVVLVDDTTEALQELGLFVRRQLAVPVVSLSGSSGKTTTRALIALALRPMGKVHQTVGNLNNHLGVPMTLLATPPDADVLVVEMGTSGPGEIKHLCELAEPTLRLFLNVGPAHLEELGGLDGVAREKGALFDTARPGNQVIANLDDPRIATFPVPKGVRRWTFGRDPAADVCLVDAAVDPETLATDATYRIRGEEHRVRIPAPGAHFAHNGAGALACALALGVEPAAAVAALADYAPVGMRMRAEPLPSGGTALNDSYNANPQSVAASLRLLASLPGRRVAVLGDMLELGPDEDRFHAETAALAGELGLDLLVLVGPRMVRARTAVSGVECWAAQDGMTLADRLADWLGPDDRVLFKGSRGARVERILHYLQGTRSEGAS